MKIKIIIGDEHPEVKKLGFLVNVYNKRNILVSKL